MLLLRASTDLRAALWRVRPALTIGIAGIALTEGVGEGIYGRLRRI